MWSKARLEYKKCNMKACVKDAKTLKCESKVAVVLVLDGSGSLGRNGWKQTKKFAKLFISAFDGKRGNAELAVLLYSGPRTWSGVGKCMGEAKMRKGAKLDLEKTCKMKWIQHFSKDLKKAYDNVDKATWPKGGTLTSLALGTVRNELPLGRKGSRSVVVVVTDGRPLSFKRTLSASRSLRKEARLMFVPVTKFAPLKAIKTWASRRWQENVVKVNNFNKLSVGSTVDHIVANLCPKIKKLPAPGSPRPCKCYKCGQSKSHNFGTGICGRSSARCSKTKAGAGCYTNTFSSCNCKNLMTIR